PAIRYVPVAPSRQYALLAPSYSAESRKSLARLLADTDKAATVNEIKSLAEVDEKLPGVLVLALDGKGFTDIGKYHPKTLQKQKIVGIGYGAAKLFRELGFQINDGACAHGVNGAPRIAVQKNTLVDAAAFESPFNVFNPSILDSTNFHNDLFFGMNVGDK